MQRIDLFGSRARRTHLEKSDFDLAVYGCRDFTGFALDVEERIDTLLKFDLVNMDRGDISAGLSEEIERDGVTIYEKI